jgi:energy-coupling factor transporter ATP-binding protein EcfA2
MTQQRVSVFDIFTPGTQAKVNFVPRNDSVTTQLVDALNTPGKQIIVYGETGSGKSTLLLNKLQQVYTNHITTQCTTATTYESLILDAFDQLGPYYVQTKTKGRAKSVSPSIGADFRLIKASIDANLSSSEGVGQARVLPPQLTAQRLAQFLGAQEMCWVIEDFHKMPATEKSPFSQSLKVFCDTSAAFPKVKAIAVGATETARQVVEYDREMRNRVAELLVPLMTDKEVEKILTNGQALLNIDLSALVIPIVRYSVGVPGVCHQLALNACLAKGINQTCRERISFTSDDLMPAMERYVGDLSDTLKASFDVALKRHKVKKFDNCRLILQALARGPLEGLTYQEILANIRRVSSDYPPGNLTSYLRALQSEERGAIIRQGLNQRYRFVDPLFHTFAQMTLTPRSPGEERLEAAAKMALDAMLKAFDDGWVHRVATVAATAALGIAT